MGVVSVYFVLENFVLLVFMFEEFFCLGFPGLGVFEREKKPMKLGG